MGSLLLVTGPPGAGKSTVAAILAQRAEPSVLVDGDAFFAAIARGAMTPWLPGSAHQNETVLRATAAAAGRYAAGGFETVVDGVVGPWFLATFAEATGLPRLDYAILLPTPETCVRQVLARTGHGFRDEAATHRMHEQFRAAEIDDRHVLAIDDETPDEIAERIVAARARGELAVAISRS